MATSKFLKTIGEHKEVSEASRQVFSILNASVGRLPPYDRRLMVLRHGQQLPDHLIARLLKKSVKTVHRDWARTSRKLRRQLLEEIRRVPYLREIFGLVLEDFSAYAALIEVASGRDRREDFLRLLESINC